MPWPEAMLIAPMNGKACWLVTAAVCIGLIALADRSVAQTGEDKAAAQATATGTHIITLGTRGRPLPTKDRAQSSNSERP